MALDQFDQLIKFTIADGEAGMSSVKRFCVIGRFTSATYFATKFLTQTRCEVQK